MVTKGRWAPADMTCSAAVQLSIFAYKPTFETADDNLLLLHVLSMQAVALGLQPHLHDCRWPLVGVTWSAAAELSIFVCNPIFRIVDDSSLL